MEVIMGQAQVLATVSMGILVPHLLSSLVLQTLLSHSSIWVAVWASKGAVSSLKERTWM